MSSELTGFYKHQKPGVSGSCKPQLILPQLLMFVKVGLVNDSEGSNVDIWKNSSNI